MSREQLAKAIERLGYKAVVVAAPATQKTSPALRTVPIPKGAPAFFADAMRRARKERRPVVIDFWATWCAPCKRLKLVTMAEPRVAKALASVEVVFVDLDKHPQLAEAFAVKSVPDVFFVAADGRVVDRLRKFEDADGFLKRLGKLSKRPSSRPAKKPDK